MAPPETNTLKRKRTITTQQQTATSKRGRNTNPPSSDTEILPPKKGGHKWRETVTGKAIEEIIDEDDTRYFVRTTVGNKSLDGWAPKGYVDEELVAAWEESQTVRQNPVTTPRKRGRPRKEVAPASPAVSSPRGRPRKSTEQPTQPTVPRGRGRPRKVQSQIIQTTQPTRVTRGNTRSSSNNPTYPPQAITTADASPIPQPGRLVVGVEVVQRSSFNPDEYERFSQLAATLSSREDQIASSAQDTGTETTSAHITPTRSFQATGIVPDSQSSNGDHNHAQSTQAAPDSTQQDSSNGDVSYDPNTQDTSGSKSQRSSNPSASYVLTTQDASGSKSQRSSKLSASYVPTTQDVSVPTQQIVPDSTASYVPTTQEASGSNHNPHLEDVSSDTYEEDINISAGFEEEGSPPSSPASVPETAPLASTQNSSQAFVRSQVEDGATADLFETNEASVLESSPPPESESSSQSVVIEESTFLDSVLETDPPSQPVLQEVDGSEVLDSIIEDSSPLKPASASQSSLQSFDISEDLGVIVEHSTPTKKTSEPPVHLSVAQQEQTDQSTAVDTITSSSILEVHPASRDEDRGTLFEPKSYEEVTVEQNWAAPPVTTNKASSHGAVESSRVAEDTFLQASGTLNGSLRDSVTRSDFAQASGNTSESSGEPLAGQSLSEPQSAPSQTSQHAAQIVPADPYLSTQDNSADNILPTIESTNIQGDPQTPDARYNSSQQRPSVSQPLASPLPRPPTFSVGTLDSHAPLRLQTPLDISSLSTTNMSDPDLKAHLENTFKAQMEEMMAKKRAENPFVPKRRKLNLGSVAPAAGSRSPSTIPDRSPLPQAPTSLRESVLAAPEAIAPEVTAPEATAPEATAPEAAAPEAAAPALAETHDSAPMPTSNPDLASIDIPTVASMDIPVEPSVLSPKLAPSTPTPPAVQVPASTSAPAPALLSTRTPIFSPAPVPAPSSAAPSLASMQMDTDDPSDSESLLNDDLELLPEEHIVPLPMEGRQRSLYTQELKRDEVVLKNFMDEPEDFDDMANVQKVLQTLRAVETHVDLVFAEAAQSSHGSSTQAQWDMENCVKFRFLGQLFRSLQDHDMNVIVVVGNDDDRIYNILEKFCRGRLLNFQIPVKGRKADPDDVEGQLIVTVLASNSSPIVRPPSAIICLDRGINTAQIRKKSWYRNPDRQTIPIIHLVIPRSIGHIERYVSDTLDSKKRLHTIFCCLAHVFGSIGLPLDDSAPTATKAAELVADYLILLDQDEADEQTEWPLKPIGSIKPEVVYQTQQSQEAISSPAPATISSKRPLDEEHLDPAKRMRMTPQPQGTVSAENELTHISDSMPGTAAQLLKLQEQLDTKQQSLEKVQAQLRLSEKRFREHTVSWEKRQREYEDLHYKHRLLLGEVESCKKSLETAIKQKNSANERFNKQSADVENMRALCKEFETTGLASEDEKIAEITRLKEQLAEAKASEARAISKAATIENTLEYTKEQYRIAQDRATEFKDTNDSLTAELTVAKKQASGEQAALKKLHLDRSFDSLVKANEGLKQKNATLQKLLSLKEDEVVKLKGAKEARMGTRGQSPRTPRPGSRAASPSRDRLNNLRNG
jgi:hypothetical protein